MMKSFKEMSDIELANFIFDNASNDEIREFCDLNEDEYVDGIEKNDTFLFEQTLDTIAQMPDEELDAFVSSISK